MIMDYHGLSERTIPPRLLGALIEPQSWLRSKPEALKSEALKPQALIP